MVPTALPSFDKLRMRLFGRLLILSLSKDGNPAMSPLGSDYNVAAPNVSHWSMSPFARPRLNQRTRCSLVPWVNESGTA